jgi:hypothetical protein
MKITGKGTTEDLAAQVASLDLNLDIPEQPSIDMSVDSLPSLTEGEGLQAPLGELERAYLGLKVASPTYNYITGLMKKEIDPEIDPSFDIANHLDLFNGVTEDNQEYIAEAVSRPDAEARRDKLFSEQKQMQDLMKDGAISGTAYMMIGGTVLDPLFWAGMAMEGVGALGMVSKSARMAALSARSIKLGKGAQAMRTGLYAAGTGMLETAVLAGEKAMVDAEDIMYAGAGGFLIGSGASALVSKFKHTGDDFLKAANAVQDDFARTTMRNMDDDLASGKVPGYLHEPDSIFGPHDPDELAQILAERTVDDIAVAPVEVVDESMGYAKAFIANVDEQTKTGVFDKLMESKTLRVLAKNPAHSDFIELFTSKSNAIKSIAVNLLEDASGATGRRKTAAVLKHMFERKFLENTMPDIRASWGEFAKSNKIGIVSKEYWGSARDEHFKVLRNELEQYRNASIKGVEYVSDQPKHIQKAVNSWRQSMAEVAELAKASGVRGFDDFVVHDGYVPLLWKGNRMAALNDADRAAYTDLLSLGYKSAGIDDKSAGIIAKAVFNRKVSQALGLDTNPGALLSKDSRAFLRELLDNNGVSEAEQKALFGRIDVTLADRGKSARAKSRVPIDLTISDSQGRKLMNIVDNDLASVGSRYFTEMSGRSALARKGIRHDGAWSAIKTAALEHARVAGHTQEELLKYSNILDSTYSQFLGRPVGTGIAKGPRRLMEWAMTSMLGTVGAAQVAESANVIAAHGISNLMKYAPDVKAYRAAIKSGTVDKSLLAELQAHIGGMWDEHLFFRPEVRLDQALGDSGDMFNSLDRVLAGSKEVLGYASGMNQVKNLQQQFTAISQANKVVKMLKSGKDNPKLLARFKDVGWDEKTLASIKSKIDDGTITFQKNGAIDRLNLENWDAKTYEDFAVGMHRHSAQIIQFPLVGETATWQHSTAGAMLSQFRAFGILAMEKQAARNIRMADQEAATAFTASLGLSALIYFTKVHAVSLGRPDREEYLEKRLNPVAVFNGALQWSGTFGLASEGVNAASAIGLLPSDWGSGAGGRTGGSAFSFDKQVPAASVLISGMRASTGMLNALSPFNPTKDNGDKKFKFGNREIDSAFAAIPLGNTYPAVLLKNALHDEPEED